MRINLYTLLLAGLGLLLLAPAPAQAQWETRRAALLAMGGGGVAAARDNDAHFFNPANLVLDERRTRIVISLAPLTAFVGGDLFQFGLYEDAFTTGEKLSDERIDEILNDWFGDGMRRATVATEVVPLSVTVRPRNKKWAVGFAMRARTASRISMDKGLFELFLQGTDETRTITIKNNFRVFSTVDFSAAFSHLFLEDKLAVGIAPKLVMGYSFMEGSSNSTVQVINSGTQTSLIHNFDYSVEAAGTLSRDFVSGINLFDGDPFEDTDFKAPVAPNDGTGFGVDLGVNYEVMPGLQVAASITDLGQMNWTGDAETITPQNNVFRFNGVTLNNDRIDNEFDGNLGDYAEHILDSLATDAYEDVNRAKGSFTRSLPTVAHIGGAWRLWKGRAMVNAGASVALNEAPGNFTKAPTVHVGGALYLGPVPLRAGLRFGAGGALTVSGGFGVRTPYYDFNLSLAATPKSDVAGTGARFGVALSLLNIRIR